MGGEVGGGEGEVVLEESGEEEGGGERRDGVSRVEVSNVVGKEYVVDGKDNRVR